MHLALHAPDAPAGAERETSSAGGDPAFVDGAWHWSAGSVAALAGPLDRARRLTSCRVRPPRLHWRAGLFFGLAPLDLARTPVRLAPHAGPMASMTYRIGAHLSLGLEVYALAAWRVPGAHRATWLVGAGPRIAALEVVALTPSLAWQPGAGGGLRAALAVSVDLALFEGAAR
jgi:hypothetical protein